MKTVVGSGINNTVTPCIDGLNSSFAIAGSLLAIAELPVKLCRSGSTSLAVPQFPPVNHSYMLDALNLCAQNTSGLNHTF